MKISFHAETCRWLFITALFVTAPNWKQCMWSSISEYLNRLWFDKEQNIDTWNNLEASLENYADWIKANPKRLQTELFNLYTILKWHNYRNAEQISSCRGRRRRVRGRREEDSSWWWNFPETWCANISILVFSGENWVKDAQHLSALFLKTSYQSTNISKYKV